MIKFIIYGGIAFVVICFIAVKWKSWFGKVSQEVVTDVTNAEQNIVNDVKNPPSSSTTTTGTTTTSSTGS